MLRASQPAGDGGSPDVPNDDLIEWCAGMPLVLQRPIEGGERVTLGREARRLRSLGVLAALSPILFGLLGLYGLVGLVAALGRAGAPTAQAVLAAWALVLAVVVLPLAVLVARDAFRRSRGLLRDLRAGYVKRYAGHPPRSRLTDETVARLQRAGHRPPSGDGEWSIEVLPASGRVWRANGDTVRRWVAARWSQVAPTPQFAAIAAQWLQPVSSSAGPALLGGQRDASEAERGEMQRYARRLRVRLLPFALGFTAWGCFVVAASAVHSAAEQQADWPRLVFLAAAALWVDVRWVRALWVAARLNRDARDGRLIILRSDRQAGDVAADAGSPEIVEILPAARWVWTEDGRPAAWRVLST